MESFLYILYFLLNLSVSIYLYQTSDLCISQQCNFCYKQLDSPAFYLKPLQGFLTSGGGCSRGIWSQQLNPSIRIMKLKGPFCGAYRFVLWLFMWLLKKKVKEGWEALFHPTLWDRRLASKLGHDEGCHRTTVALCSWVKNRERKRKRWGWPKSFLLVRDVKVSDEVKPSQMAKNQMFTL